MAVVVACVAKLRKSQLFVKARSRDVVNINVTLDEISGGEGVVAIPTQERESPAKSKQTNSAPNQSPRASVVASLTTNKQAMPSGWPPDDSLTSSLPPLKDLERGGGAPGSGSGTQKVHSSMFHKRAVEEARKAVEAKTGAGAADVADVAGAAGSIPDASLAEDGSGTQRAPAPQSLAALLTACGLEHRAKNFEDEAYTLETLLSSVKQGEEIAKGDLRELKLTLGECRRLLNHLSAHEMTRDVSFTLRRNSADL